MIVRLVSIKPLGWWHKLRFVLFVVSEEEFF